MSRIRYHGECPIYRRDFELQDLACGGCHYCRRAHQNWGEFLNVVDDVIPLTIPLTAAQRPSKDEATQCDDNLRVRRVNHHL